MADAGSKSGAAATSAGIAAPATPQDEATSPLKPDQAAQAAPPTSFVAASAAAQGAASANQPDQAPGGVRTGAGFTLGAFGKLHGTKKHGRRVAARQPAAQAGKVHSAEPAAAAAAQPDQATTTAAAGDAWRSYAGKVQQQAPAAASDAAPPPWGSASGIPSPEGFCASPASRADAATAPDQAPTFSFGKIPAQGAPAAPNAVPHRPIMRRQQPRRKGVVHDQHDAKRASTKAEGGRSQPQPKAFRSACPPLQQPQPVQSHPKAGVHVSGPVPAGAQPAVPSSAQPATHPGSFHTDAPPAATTAVPNSSTASSGPEPFRFRSPSVPRSASQEQAAPAQQPPPTQQQAAAAPSVKQQAPAAQPSPAGFQGFRGAGLFGAPGEASIDGAAAHAHADHFQGFGAGKTADGGAFSQGAAMPRSRVQRGGIASTGDGRPRRRASRVSVPEQSAPAPARQPQPEASAQQQDGRQEAIPSPSDREIERLRQRGNDAFERGSYTRAADLYQRVRAFPRPTKTVFCVCMTHISFLSFAVARVHTSSIA